MANRIKLYPLVRKIHLYTGLSLMGFVLMYFLTAWLMTHWSWFAEEKHEPTKQMYAFEAPEQMTQRELAFHIRDQFDLNGYVEIPDRQTDSTFHFETYRPGINHQITVHPKKDSLEVKTTKDTFLHTTEVFHRIHGYGGGWIYDLYALLLDLSSLSMIVFVITGVYLWLKLIRIKWLGWSMIGVSLLYTLSVLWQLMA